MNTLNIVKLAIAIGRYVAERPELVAKIVLLTVKAVSKISGLDTDAGDTRGLEEDTLVAQIVEEYNRPA